MIAKFVHSHRFETHADLKIFKTIKELQTELQLFRKTGASIGFVPTMGALHEGHIALIKRSVLENPVTVCSIFVNPTQFNNAEDLEKYPRTVDADIEMLEKNNCTVVFIPSVVEIYPEKKILEINFGMLETTMEGAYRPGHFKGVATVVNTLFQIVEPDVAYFGEKDFQQLAVVRHLVKQFQLSVKIAGCETVREKDGLAMSSRNIHLTPEERKQVAVIYQSLLSAKEDYQKKISVHEIKNGVVQKIESANLFKVQYFEIVNAETLQPIVESIFDISIRACIAVLTSRTRLIDNLSLDAISQN
jgi:pantoate--beta-alanine ligase